MDAYYTWILAFHVMSFISWMAMLFYLPRLFVYHSEHATNEGFVAVVQIQEQKIIKIIGTPAMWATVLSGGAMLWINPGLFQGAGWMHVKLFFAGLMIAYHFSLEYHRKRLLDDPRYRPGKFYRFYNEVPTLLMIVIVIMVVVKPI
jgi:protoporphyrinogen IX oxidase